MRKSKKILNKLKTNIKSMSDYELEWTLKYYENDLEHIAYETGIKNLFICYNKYLEVEEKKRQEYEQLQLQLNEAKDNARKLNMIDPSLYERYHNGESDYFYMGSISDRIENQQQIELLQKNINILEQNEPRLRFRNMQDNINVSLQGTMLYYTAKEKIKIINREIQNRQKQKISESSNQNNKS